VEVLRSASALLPAVSGSHSALCLPLPPPPHLALSLVNLVLGKRSEDLTVGTHSVVTVGLMVMVTAIVLALLRLDLGSGALFGVILDITGGVGGEEAREGWALTHLRADLLLVRLLTSRRWCCYDAGALNAFILPAGIYLKIMPTNNRPLQVAAYATLFFGVAIMTLVVGVTVREISS